MMTTLEELYAKQNALKDKEVTGFASSMKRKVMMDELQKEIEYYERGDVITRTEIQADLAEMKKIHEEINRLNYSLNEKKQKLWTKVFGEQSIV